MKTIFLFLFLSLNLFASDADIAAKSEWKPLIYNYLDPESQQLIDDLEFATSRNMNILNHHFSNLRMHNCAFDTVFKNNQLTIVITDTVSEKKYRLIIKPFKAKYGLITKKADASSEYYFLITDSSENPRGFEVTGETFTIEVRYVTNEDNMSVIDQIHVMSSLKTIYSGFLLGPIGAWLGQKPVVRGLDLVCTL
jgi:hypothetical protein